MELQQSEYMYKVDGTIQAIRLATGILNLIEDVQNGSFLTGIVAGLGGQHGALANSASSVMYDGEDVEHIAMLINDKLAVGTFEWLRDLRVGDTVTIVGSDIDEGPMFIHAILRQNDQMLWTPLSVGHTRRGWVLSAIKMGGFMLAFTWLMAGLATYFNDSILGSTEIVMIIFFPIFLASFVMFMSTRDVLHLGDKAEAIFQILDVPRSDRFNIKPFSICKLHLIDDPDSLKKGNIFKFSDALRAHKLKFNLT
jgi:hypothetical protein